MVKVVNSNSRWTMISYTTERNYPMLGLEYEVDRGPETSCPFDHHETEYGREGYSDYETLSGSADGWEFKSAVGPLSFHKRALPKFIKLGNLASRRTRNHGGIHINISKLNNQTSAIEEKVIPIFTFLHDTTNRTFFRSLSERTRHMFDHYSPQSSNHWDHYYGIITNRKYYAYELRLFKAEPYLILPALEMADSLFRMALQEPETIDLDTYRSFIYKKRRWSHLNDQLTTQGLW